LRTSNIEQRGILPRVKIVGWITALYRHLSVTESVALIQGGHHAAERHPMNYDYQDFEIEPFELGRGLWHARFGRADKQPVVIDGVMFSTLNVGLAWPNPDAAVDDAKAAIDRLTKSMVASFGGSRINPQLGHEA
jgi:hypothetical protein